jgi:threonyl-tRNA synthetase
MAKDLSPIRHTLAHLLASAVREKYPHAKPTIGPAIDNGFYYDYEFTAENKPTEKDLKDIEKKMRKLFPFWKEMSGKEVFPEEACAVFAGN